MVDLRSLTIEELEDLAVSLGQKKFRAKQVFGWLYKGIHDLEEMKNLPGHFIESLSGSCGIGVPEVLRHQVSQADGTEKFLFGFGGQDAAGPGGELSGDSVSRGTAEYDTAESVLMRYKYGNSVCVSTQVGCKMGCAFCASGINGLVRHLTAGEIVSQVLEIQASIGERVSRVVFMGTGEPFDNYDNVAKAIRIMHEPEGLGISMRNFTVSICGVLPGIKDFARDFPEVNLAISLHAPDNSLRKSLMPIAGKYPLDELMAAVDGYVEATNRRVSYEYAMIKGVNDGDEQLAGLVGLLRGRLAHVNLIPLNEVDESGLESAGREKALKWKAYLEEHGVPATVRRQLGADIDGACGQLRNRG